MSHRIAHLYSAALQASVSNICLGGMQFGWAAGPDETYQLLDAFREAGGNLVDTSDNYSIWVSGNKGGESERLIGEWMRSRGRHREVLVATKVGYESGIGSGLSREHILRSAEGSLRRLGIESIAVYQVHRADSATPIEETILALLELRDKGLIRSVGFCNLTAIQLTDYLDAASNAGLTEIFGYQGKLNYLERERLTPDLLKLIRERGLVCMAYGLMARGYLSGKYTIDYDSGVSIRANSVREKYFTEDNHRRLDVFLAEAKSSGLSPARSAFEWARAELVASGVGSVLIGGFTCVPQFREATGLKPRPAGIALANYLSYRKAACVGRDPAYRPLLEELIKRHPDGRSRPAVYAGLPVLGRAPGAQLPETAALLLRDILAAASGGRWWPDNGLLTPSQRRVLIDARDEYRKKVFGLLQRLHFDPNASPSELERVYVAVRRLLSDRSALIRGLAKTLAELDAALRFYLSASDSGHRLLYQEFPYGSLETLIQPQIDCCLFDGRSRHRAATVAFLAHPAVRLMALYDTERLAAVGATVELDMVDDNGDGVRVLDSVEIGDYRNRLGVRYGWKELVMRGVIRRCLHDGGCRMVLFNSGYDESLGQGYLSHEAAREFASWLKQRFEPTRIRLAIQGGLNALLRLGSIEPRLNLEVLSTKALNNMFNRGEGLAVGVLMDVPGQQYLAYGIDRTLD